MIQDMTLRWVVTLLFVFSAAVCVQTIVANRHSVSNLISHSLHAIMAVAMAVMAWPTAMPPRGPKRRTPEPCSTLSPSSSF